MKTILNDYKLGTKNLSNSKIFCNYIAQPLSSKDLLKVESEFGQVLPEDLKQFYNLCNGVRLSWRKNTSKPMYETDISKAGCPFPFMWPAEHYWQLDGVINIPDLQTLLFQNYPNFMWFDFEKNYENTFNGKVFNGQEFKKTLRPFDVFDKYYTAALYISSNGTYVLLGDDHNASFLNFKPLSLNVYLENILRNFGEIASRLDHFERLN